MVWDKITGALSSAGDSLTGLMKAEEETPKTDIKGAFSGLSSKMRNGNAGSAIEKGKKRKVKMKSDYEKGLVDESSSLTTDQRLADIDKLDSAVAANEGSDWTSALGEAAKFLAANRKEKPKPSTPSLGSRSVNFDAGSFYGALNARQAAFNNFGLK